MSGPLDFEASINTSQFNRAIDDSVRRIQGLGDITVKEGNKIDETFRNIAAGITAYFGANLIGNLTSQMTQIRGEFQQLEISFETMLKNKALSDKLMSDVVEFAAKTPFDLNGVATGAKQLLAYGTSAEDIIPTMRQLGDVAAGLSIPFNDLVYLYGTSATQGKLMTKDLMQFAGRGIPIIEELSKSLSVSKARILEMATEGKIGFEDLQVVIANLTSETGMFGGMMDKQSKSILGLKSNLGDAWDQMLNDVGRANQSTIEGTYRTVISVVENYQNIIDILKVIVATYGAYRAAVILNSIAINGFNTALNVTIIKEKLLALVRSANPWGLALAGVTALVGALWSYNRATDTTSKSIEEFNQKLTTSTAESNALFDKLKKTTEGTEARKVAIRSLAIVHGEYINDLGLEKAALIDIETAQKAVNDEMVRRIAIDQSDKEKQVWYEKEVEILKQLAKANIDVNALMEERNNPQYNEYGNRVFVSYGKEIDNLLANYDQIQNEKKSIDELYANIVSALKTAITKPLNPPEGTGEIKTLEQKLKEIKQQYENYYLWAKTYGSKSADEQYSNLVKSGKSYLEYLNNEIAKIENKKSKTTLDNSNLITFIGAKEALIGDKNPLEQFKNQIDEAKEKYKDLSDYIEYLKGQLLAVGAFDGSEQSFEKIQLLYSELNKSEKDFITNSFDNYEALMSKTKDFATQRVNVENEYQAQVKKLNEKTLGKEKYDEAIKLARQLADEKLEIISEEEFKSKEAYKKIATEIKSITKKEALSYLNILKQQAEKLDKQSALYKEIQGLIKQTESALKLDAPALLNDTAESMKSVAYSVGLVDEQLGMMVDTMANVVSGISKMAEGDMLGGIIQLGTSVFSYIVSSSDKAAEAAKAAQQAMLDSLSERLSNINTILERQIALIDELSGTQKLVQYSQSFKDLSTEIASVLSQIDKMNFVSKGYRGTINKSLDPLIKTYSEIFGNGRVLPEGLDSIDVIQRLIDENKAAISDLYKELLSGDLVGDQAEELKILIEALENNTDTFEELKAQYNEYLTGTTSANIIDSIISGFEEGKLAAEDFADTFEELMKKAMLQAIKMKYLEGPLEQWYNTFAAYNEDGLTQEEIAALRDAYNTIINSAAAEAQNIQNIVGNTTGTNDTLSGSIKGVTEETAGLIAGQMNAIRINQAHALALMDEQLANLSEIASNTRYNRLLVDIKNILQSGSSNSTNTNRANGG